MAGAIRKGEGEDEGGEKDNSALVDDLKEMEKMKEHYKHRKIIFVKKSLKDPTAALSYSLGISILHLAMFIGCFVFIKPQIAKTDDMPLKCKQEAEDLYNHLTIFEITHFLTFFSTLYREIYSAKTDLSGQLMRILEVICILILTYAELYTF